jgi:hypothetical protein
MVKRSAASAKTIAEDDCCEQGRPASDVAVTYARHRKRSEPVV